MPRAMWRGAIQFGLVTIPVRLYLATETRRGISFNMLHAEDEKRIQMKVHCPEHGEIQRSDTVRGYEWSKGQYVIMEEEDFEAVPLKTLRSIEIEQFVPAQRKQHEAVFVKQSYYLEPEPMGRKAFRLLKTVLADSELQAVCKIVLKDREQLASLDPFGSTMLLSTLYWPDEVRDAGDLDIPGDEEEFKQAELDMARQLVGTLTSEFDESRYKDEYREALMKVIDAKVAGQPLDTPATQPEPSKLTDLMAVLEASVAAARAESDPDSPAASTPEKPVSVTSARKAKSARSKSAAAKPARVKAAKPARGKAAKPKATKSRSKSSTAPSHKSSKSAPAPSSSAGQERKTA